MAPLIGLVQNSDDIRDKVGAQNKVPFYPLFVEYLFCIPQCQNDNHTLHQVMP